MQHNLRAIKIIKTCALLIWCEICNETCQNARLLSLSKRWAKTTSRNDALNVRLKQLLS